MHHWEGELISQTKCCFGESPCLHQNKLHRLPQRYSHAYSPTHLPESNPAEADKSQRTTTINPYKYPFQVSEKKQQSIFQRKGHPNRNTLGFMGSENEPANIQTSSIALLQERFRQLQRMREMREKRELLRFFAGAQSSRTAQPKWVFHQNCLYPSRLLWSNTHAHEEEGRAFQDMGISPSMSQWSEKFNETEVDTSLHL